MPDPAAGQVVPQLHRHVAFDDLAVVQVHLHLQIRRADGLHDAVRLVLPVQQVAGDVAAVDRLDQHLAADGGSLPGGPGQVGLVGGLQAGPVHTRRRQAGHHMQARAAQRVGIGQGLLETAAELGLAAGQAGEAALTGIEVAGRGVEQHLLQAMVGQAPGQRLGLEGIGEEEFHRLEAVGGGSGKAVEKGLLGVEHAQVGGKAGHGGLVVGALAARAELLAQFGDLVGGQRVRPIHQPQPGGYLQVL